MSQHRAPAVWVRPGHAATADAGDAVLGAEPSVRVAGRPPRPPATGVGADAGLVSGEAVELDVRIARVGSRAVALLLDIIVQVSALSILTPMVVAGAAAALPFADDALIQGLVVVCFVLVLVGYPVIFEVASGGRTLGKLALGLRVVRDDGGPIRFRHALTRTLVGVALEWPGLVLPLITWVASLATMLSSPRGKRLGDLAAGTIVIHERSPAAWGWVPGMPPPLATWATSLDLTGLSDDLALAVRHFLARGHALAEPERSRLGYALAAEVTAATTPHAPPGVPGWAYLAAVLAERHRRAAHRLARARAVTARLWPELTVAVAGHPAAGWPVSGPLGITQPRMGAPQTASGLGSEPGTQLSAGHAGQVASAGPTPWAPPGSSGPPDPPGQAGPPAPSEPAPWAPATSESRSPASPDPGWPAPGTPVRAAAPPSPANHDWVGHVWPTPPWQAATGDHQQPDWTGLRPPPVASTLRPSSPSDPA